VFRNTSSNAVITASRAFWRSRITAATWKTFRPQKNREKPGQIYFLRTLSWDDAGNLRGTGIYSHDYDGKNQRVRTKTPDGAETYTFTTQNGLTLGEYGPTGSYTREYAYLGTQLIALIDHDTYGTERTSYLHPNALGSPVAATDTQGNLLWKETYNPYGERKLKQPNSTTNNRWYTGHTEDPTGLVYAGARYYDPTIGRFLSTDPVAFTEKNPHSFNRYSYANNNPYKYVDPDGRESLFHQIIAIEYNQHNPQGSAYLSINIWEPLIIRFSRAIHKTMHVSSRSHPA
jgi:RHS repeat-associated protein